MFPLQFGKCGEGQLQSLNDFIYMKNLRYSLDGKKDCVQMLETSFCSIQPLQLFAIVVFAFD